MSEYEVCPCCFRHDGTHDEWCIELEIATLKKKVKGARKQAFLEAAELAENYEVWNENILRFAKLLREKAEECDGAP